VDRKSRFTRIAKVQKIDAKLTHKATVRLLAGQRVRTITNDNGPEFADYKHTAKRLNTSVYFSDPYCSWQRGTNENTNGLIRQYFPKGTDFSKVSTYKIKKVENLLNTRPRKNLCFRTPSEVVKRKKSGVALRS
jgi:IS30 family transposase